MTGLVERVYLLTHVSCVLAGLLALLGIPTWILGARRKDRELRTKGRQLTTFAVVFAAIVLAAAGVTRLVVAS